MEKFVGKGSSKDLNAIYSLTARGYEALYDLKHPFGRMTQDNTRDAGSGNANDPKLTKFGSNPTEHTLVHEALHQGSRHNFSGLGFARDFTYERFGNRTSGLDVATAVGAQGKEDSIYHADALTYALGF